MKTARWIKYILAALLAVSCFVSMTACSFGSDISKKMMIQGIGIDKRRGRVFSFCSLFAFG